MPCDGKVNLTRKSGFESCPYWSETCTEGLKKGTWSNVCGKMCIGCDVLMSKGNSI